MRHTRGNFRFRQAQQLQGIGQIRPNRAPQHNRALKDIGLTLPHRFGRYSPADRAAGEPINPMQDLEQRGLSSAIRSQDNRETAAGQIKIKRPQNSLAAAFHHHALQLSVKVLAHHRPSRSVRDRV